MQWPDFTEEKLHQSSLPLEKANPTEESKCNDERAGACFHGPDGERSRYTDTVYRRYPTMDGSLSCDDVFEVKGRRGWPDSL